MGLLKAYVTFIYILGDLSSDRLALAPLDRN